jgi:hypothetical protein
MLWVLFLMLFAAGPKPTPHHVYVFTADAPDAASSSDVKDCGDAVKDLRDALGKKKGVALVDDRPDADVTLEVVKCESRDMGTGGFGGKTLTPFDEKLIHVHAVSSADQTDFRGEAPGYWNRAAKDAADRIAKWIERQPRAKER